MAETPGGGLALPGGFVTETESADETAARKLKEKAGVHDIYLEQLAAFTQPTRDPRGWIPSVAYLALVPADTVAADPAAYWVSAASPPTLAYDHGIIVSVAVDRVRGKLWWSNIAVGLLPARFTLAEARRIYEAIANTRYDPSTFGRDLRSTGLVVTSGEVKRQTRGRPAALYSFTQRAPTWGSGRRKRISPRPQSA